MTSNTKCWAPLAETADNVDDAFAKGDLLWNPDFAPLTYHYEGNDRPVEFSQAIVRNDTGLILHDGIVGSNYGMVTNSDFKNLITQLSGEIDTTLEIDSAFHLQGGARTCVLVNMPDLGDEIVEGDKVYPFLMFHNAHNGKGSIDICPSMYRPVCSNTIQLVIRQAKEAGNSWKVRHTRFAMERLVEAVKIIGNAINMWDGDIALAKQMAEIEMTSDMMTAFMDQVIPIPEKATDRVKNARSKVRGDIIYRYENGTRNNLPGMERTLWAAVNAVTERVDHEAPSHMRGEVGSRKRNENEFLHRTETGGAKLKLNAWNTARQIVQHV